MNRMDRERMTEQNEIINLHINQGKNKRHKHTHAHFKLVYRVSEKVLRGEESKKMEKNVEKKARENEVRGNVSRKSERLTIWLIHLI